MLSWLDEMYYRLQIKLLLVFKPVVLFGKINQLDWYQNTLRQWFGDQHIESNGKVLEVGCASGSLTAYISGFLQVLIFLVT